MSGWRTALAVMWVGLVACSENEKGSNASTTVDREDFNAEAAQAVCERYERCGLIDDVERCQEQQLSWGFARQVGLGTRYDAAFESGHIRYDAEAAARCVELLREGACDESPYSLAMTQRGIEYDARCRFLLGQVQEGGACQWSTECGDGTYCDALPWTCGGVCKAGTVAEPVIALDACAPGTVLIGGRCLTPGAAGARCGAENGKALGVCGAGTYCDQAQGTHGTCQRVASEGAACHDYDGPQCGWSLFCRDGRCQRARDEGEPCKAPGTGRFGTLECRDELFCDGDNGHPGTCQPKREAGAACRNAFECGEGLNCSGAVPLAGVWGACQPAPRQGEPCAGQLCAVGQVCSSISNTCVETVRVGEPCTDPDQCYLSGTCVGGICRPIGAESCG
ncbi:hypothetical protein [Pyxidicoccus xibeiensis]|uniref:hypothetical protein n=1 Tax=Pyxidicoccus xibeiensis TaxID=2906759 RepID=UPI0020A7F063|nr:hypothetical protein [Pyxidicoccus xibeiensis]MCP3136471.1 hypothetical protein [Pyxidicoccus xibeiensis]